jgi:hypothetical protein
VQSLKSPATESATPSAAPDISALAKRFVEPARGDEPAVPRPAFPKPTLVTQALSLPDRQTRTAGQPTLPAPPQRKRRLNRNAVVSAVVMVALIPLAILFVRLWQDNVAPRAGDGASPAAEATAKAAAQTASPAQQPSSLEVALSSPDRVEAKAGEAVAFPIVIDATAALPARSIVAVTALPEGATFSEGRPYGETGWSLRPDEIGDLQLRLPEQSSAADIRLELVAGDGTVLAQSETRLSVAPSPDAVQPVAAVTTDPFAAPATEPAATEPSEQVEAVETTGSIANVPAPTRKPTASADSSVKVNKVKAVTIPAPRASRPHDGAYALAPPQDDAQTSGEWMVTKTAVDMHAKAEQSSETVKVADGGLKVRVTARDKNWIQVHDPKSSTTGWIYNRFLKPADASAQ